MPTDRLKAHQNEAPDMSADSIAGRRFAQSWRGFDAEEVKQFLSQVASQVRSLRDRLEVESAARREAEQRASHPEMDEAALMTAVGEETAGILRTARSAASDITAKAKAGSDALLAVAEAKAAALVAEAEALLATRSSQAEAHAEESRAKAMAEADELKAQATQEAERLAQEASEKYRQTIESAQEVRERILTDLARRRKLGTVQVEQLRAGRERLLDAYLMVRRTLDDVTDELQRADAEARAAADAVGRQNGSDHGEELVDLRGDEGGDALSAFSELKAPPSKPPTGQVPLALVPRAGPPNGQHPDAGAAPLEPAGVGAATAIVSRSDAIESVRILPREAQPAADTSPGGTRAVPEAKAGPTTTAMPPQAKASPPAPESPQAAELPEVPQAADVLGAPAPGKDVDDLFARIRAGRQEATTSARKALSDTALDDTDLSDTALDEAVAPLSAPAVERGPEVADEFGSAGLSEAGPGPLATDDEDEVAAGDEDLMPTASQEDQQLLHRRDGITAHLESSLARKLKRELQDEQNSLLDRLRSLKVPASPANVLPAADEHPDRFVEVGRPLLEEAARAGAKLASELAGKATPPAIKASAIEDLAEELGRSIAEPLRQRLELAFRGQDEETSELADALGAAYREWKTQRIEAAARDQVAAAFSRGGYLAMAQGTVLRWVVSAAEGPCPDCEDNALAGNQPKGEPWPTGQLYPPAHPGCRCAVAPAQAVTVLPN